MAKTVIALHDDIQSAFRMVQRLLDEGFSHDNLSFISPVPVEPKSPELFPLRPASAATQVVPVIEELRELLVAVDAIKVPGIGSVLTAGPLSAQLNIQSSQSFSRTNQGNQGGLMGALVALGVPEERSHYYAEGVHQGCTLVMLKTPDYRAREAVEIINLFQPVDLNRRVRQWRQSGWRGYNSL